MKRYVYSIVLFFSAIWISSTFIKDANGYIYFLFNNADNLTSGTLPNARLDKSSVTLRGTLFDGTQYVYVSSLQVRGTVTSTAGFVGDGSKLTGIGQGAIGFNAIFSTSINLSYLQLGASNYLQRFSTGTPYVLTNDTFTLVNGSITIRGRGLGVNFLSAYSGSTLTIPSGTALAIISDGTNLTTQTPHIDLRYNSGDNSDIQNLIRFTNATSNFTYATRFGIRHRVVTDIPRLELYSDNPGETSVDVWMAMKRSNDTSIGLLEFPTQTEFTSITTFKGAMDAAQNRLDNVNGGVVTFDSVTFRGVVTTTSGFVGSASSMTFNGQRYTFPPDDGTSGQVLETDGSGVLTWAADDTGGGGATVSPSTKTYTFSSSGDVFLATNSFSPLGLSDSVSKSTWNVIDVRAEVTFKGSQQATNFQLAWSTALTGGYDSWTYVTPQVVITTDNAYSNWISTAFRINPDVHFALHCTTAPVDGTIPSQYRFKMRYWAEDEP